MPDPKKKVLCLECEKEFDPEEAQGVCPECGLDNQQVRERDRYERALGKLREQRSKGDPKKKKKYIGGIWG